MVRDAVAKTFLGGFLIGAAEMGIGGFGGNFGAALGSGADFSDAMAVGGIGLGIGAAVGGLIEGSYLSGMQNVAHGMGKEEVARAQARQQQSENALNVDKSSAVSEETVIGTGKEEFPTGRKMELFLGKEPIDGDARFLSTSGKVAGLATGTPTFSIMAVKYSFEMLTEWAKFSVTWQLEDNNFNLISRTQIHGTEYWKHEYYYKQTVLEPGGFPENQRFYQ